MRTRTEEREAPPEDRALRLARRRFARRQWARRWLAWRIVLSIVLLASAVGGLVWLVFFSTALAVQGVQVAGTEVLDQQEVRSVAAVPRGAPLATVDLDSIAGRVSRLAPVRDVDVSRAWPDQVRIEVTEREAVAVVERDGIVQGVDATGVRFRRYPTRPDGLPLLRTGPGTPADALAESTRVVESLPGDIAAMVDYVEVGSVDTITLRLRDGRGVLWGSAEQSSSKADVLAVLLDQEASSYDVSVPGQPVVRP